MTLATSSGQIWPAKILRTVVKKNKQAWPVLNYKELNGSGEA